MASLRKLTTWAGTLPGISDLQNATIPQMWSACRDRPLGKQLFSQLIKLRVPYSGTIGAMVRELGDGHAVLTMADRRAVRNHLDCIHAIALMNLGELTTGLAMFHALDGRARGIVTSLRIEYYKKARGTLTATCDAQVPTVAAAVDMTVDGQIRDGAGDIVCKVWATWTLKPL